uniref:Anaphase-promoting complex subunit 5 N-terminal domain-containing protein n=1 Tax=Hucho hucho TaxID=62062 RepID=A0A4W5K0B9_9TELE
MEYFFATLPTPFSAIDSEAFKTSVVGLLMRHMPLAYIKLPFKQVYKLYKALQHYYHNHYTHSDMDLTSTEDTVGERMEEEELDTAPLHESLKVEVVVEGSTVSSAYPLQYAYFKFSLFETFKSPLHCPQPGSTALSLWSLASSDGHIYGKSVSISVAIYVCNIDSCQNENQLQLLTQSTG